MTNQRGVPHSWVVQLRWGLAALKLHLFFGSLESSHGLPARCGHCRDRSRSAEISCRKFEFTKGPVFLGLLPLLERKAQLPGLPLAPVWAPEPFRRPQLRTDLRYGDHDTPELGRPMQAPLLLRFFQRLGFEELGGRNEKSTRFWVVSVGPSPKRESGAPSALREIVWRICLWQLSFWAFEPSRKG